MQVAPRVRRMGGRLDLHRRARAAGDEITSLAFCLFRIVLYKRIDDVKFYIF